MVAEIFEHAYASSIDQLPAVQIETIPLPPTTVQVLGFTGVQGVNVKGVPFAYWRGPDGKFASSPFRDITAMPPRPPQLEVRSASIPKKQVVGDKWTRNCKVVLPPHSTQGARPSVATTDPTTAIFGNAKPAVRPVRSLAAERMALVSFNHYRR